MTVKEHYLFYHWNILLAHVSKYYPLDCDFIDTYSDELDWASLSTNTLLKWDDDFLEKYEHLFTWHELCWNSSIIWSMDRIKKFNKRVDWHYLIQNVNLPLSEEFLDKHRKKRKHWYVPENNPYLTKQLIDKYDLKTNEPRKKDTKVTKLSPEEVENLLQNLDPYENQHWVYQEAVLPFITQHGLLKLFEEKYNSSQRYFHVQPLGHDAYGLTPELKFSGGVDSSKQRDAYAKAIAGKLSTLEFGSLMEGTPRLNDMPRWNTIPLKVRW